jgi:hypothetical protein
VVELTAIEAKYFDLVENQISLKEFEQWVYHSPFLEKELNEDQYLDLIALNYNTPSSIYELSKILIDKINKGKFEKKRMCNILNSIINRDGNEAKNLILCYDLYCKGYDFLKDLGIGIGLYLDVPSGGKYSAASTEIEKNELLESVYPQARELAVELLQWINEDKIKFTGNQDEAYSRWEYFDERNMEEKESRVWKAEEIETKTNEVRTEKISCWTKMVNLLIKIIKNTGG